MIIIRNPPNSTGNYLGSYITAEVKIKADPSKEAGADRMPTCLLTPS